MDRKVFEFGMEDAGPGPAAYGTRTTVGRLNRLPTVADAPSSSMHKRLDLSDETDGPGPVVYNLARLTCRGRALAPQYSMAKKLPVDGDLDNPGPAAYKPRVPVNGPVPKMLFPIVDPDPVMSTILYYFKFYDDRSATHASSWNFFLILHVHICFEIYKGLLGCFRLNKF